MLHLQKHDLHAEMEQKKSSAVLELTEESGLDDKVVRGIRARGYKLSNELELHRKMLMKIVEKLGIHDEDWEAFVQVVEEVIAEASEEPEESEPIEEEEKAVFDEEGADTFGLSNLREDEEE